MLIFSFSSCTVLRTHTTKTSDIYGLGVIQKPLVVDLDVKDKRVSGTASTSFKGEKIETIKNNAIYDALQNSKADVLVEPRFDTETSGDRTTVTVTGYPANYKNFRPATINDTTYLKLGISRTAKSYEPAIDLKKKGVGAAVGATVGSVLLVIILLGALL